MGIDHVIDLNCVPKETLTTPGILIRLKALNRAEAVIKLYRDNDDQRSPSEMGFEMVRRLPDGSEETQTIIVQHLLDEAEELNPLARHCKGCPANRAKRPFGCFGYVNYPISQVAEIWLLKQLPTPDEPLIFLLLSKTMRDFVFNNQQIAAMRNNPGIFFETKERFAKNLEEAQISTDQVFEMLFLTERIQPAHAALLLIFFGAVKRDMDAETLISLTEPGGKLEFIAQPDPSDDESITAIKAYFESLYVAHNLGVTVSLDA